MTSNKWTEYRNRGYPVMDLWEDVIKKDIKRLALQRSKILNYKKNRYLDLLYLCQTHLVGLAQEGDLDCLG